MATGEQRGCRAGRRGEAQKRSRRARHRSEAQHAGAVPGRGGHASGDVGKPDLEYGRFGKYIRQLEERWAKLEDRHKAHVEAEIESRATQWRDYMVERQRVLDDDRASMVEQITAGSKKLKQGFDTHAENLKDLMAQSCCPGMARLADLEEKAEELESQRDMEDRVNKLNTLISDRLQNAGDECDSFRARFEHLESQLKTAMGDRTHIYGELRKLNEEAKNQSDGMRELEKKLEEQADELRADLKCHEKVTIGLVLKHLPKKERHPTVTAETEGDEEEVALTSATTKRKRVTSDSCGLAAPSRATREGTRT